MSTAKYIVPLLVAVTLSCESEKAEGDYPITPVPFTDITLKDNFWSKRIETNSAVTIPFGFNKCEEEGRKGILNII
ncbi:MAG: hypothetical protein ACREOO_33065 [bacterium]